MNNRRWWTLAIIVTILLLLIYGGGSLYFANLVLSSPTTSLAEAEAEVGDPAQYGLPEPETVQIDTGSVTLAGWYFENGHSEDCAVIFMHGYTGTRAQVLYWAPLFWERGCDILAYDHRGHGESTPAMHTYGYFEKQDGLAVLDWLEKRTGLTASDIGVAGVSYGAATALQMAPLAPDLAFVLADSPYRSLKAILTYQAEQQFGVVGRAFLSGAILNAQLLAGFDVGAVSPETAVSKAEMPILLIHSATDEFTPVENSRAIFANSNHDKTVLDVNEWGSEHATDIVTDFAGYDIEVDAFLDQYVPGFGQE